MSEIIDDVLVLKVGTSTLVEKTEDGKEQLDVASFARIGKQVLALQEAGQNIVIVSSAAITAGMMETGQSGARSSDMHELQRLASIGWRHVLNAWDDALGSKVIGELLLTRRELTDGPEREEALRVTHTLLRHGDVAVANENDAITHEEIAFGDNDTLAASFAGQIKQSTLFGNTVRLVLLSDINGVYADVTDTSSVIARIEDPGEYEHLASDTGNHNGTGGMITKFSAAKIANASGVDMWITNGRTDNAIHRALSGQIGTHFVAG